MTNRNAAFSIHGQAGRALLAVVTALLFLQSLTVSAPAAAQNQQYELDIPAQDLGTALNALSRASRTQISASSGTLEGRTSNAINGTYTIPEALEKMVAGTRMAVSRVGDNSYTMMAPDAGSSQLSGPLEEIVVTGSYTRRFANSATGLNMTLRETPQSVTVISEERMEAQNLTEISEVLNEAVGVTYSGSTLGSDGTYFYSRGFSVSNYQIDGVPRPSGIYGFQEETSDMTAYDRIEIIRGATGLMNGVGNPAASINFIRKRPTEELGGGLSAQTGSWNRYRFALDVSGTLTGNGRVRGLLSVAHQESDSHIDRIHLEKQAMYGIVEVDLTDNTLLSLGIEYQDFQNTEAPRGGIPEFYADGTKTELPQSTNTSAYWGDLSNSSTNLFATLEHRFANDWLVRVNTERAEPEYDELMGYLTASGTRSIDPATGTGAEFYSARWSGDLEQDFIGAYLQGGFDGFGREHDFVLGMSHSKSSDEGPEYCGWWCGGDYVQAIPDAFAFLADGRSGVVKPDLDTSSGLSGGSIRQNSVYTAIRLRPLDRVAVIIGGRVTDWKEIEWYTSGGARVDNPANEENGVVTPYAGIVVDFTRNLSGYASYTQIFEPQNYDDINGRKLDPLEGTNYEVGIKSEFYDGLLSASVGVYRTQQDNYPIYISGVFSVSGGYVYRAEDGAVSEGVELEIAGELLPGWQMVGGFSHNDARDREGGPLLANIPDNTFKLFTSYALQGNLDGLIVGGNLRWQGEANTESSGPGGETFTYTQDSLAILDLMASYAFSENLSFQVNVNNVLDKNYYSGLARHYGTPRNVAASVKWGF